MSEPAWVLYLEKAEFESNYDPAKMIEFLLSDKMQDMPETVKQTQLKRYGYEAPQPVKRGPGRPKKEQTND